jgi:hypothetical protein
MRFLLRRRAVFLAACFAALPFLCAPPQASEQLVPFVGCAGDGQTGPVAAPKGDAKAIDIDATAASRLALYQAQDSFGVLAPRGWNCFYLYGSNGASLLVSPGGGLNASNVRLNGPAVVVTLDNGGTSGRFAVARYSARLFPKIAQAFVAGVIAEGIEPKKNFPSGPYPADKLIYKSARVVEFTTPGGKDGLGVSGRLLKNASPVVGVATLKDTPDGPDFLLLAVRLPADQADLGPAIVAQSEQNP